MYYSLTVNQTLEKQKSRLQGLTQEEAQERQRLYGLNKLSEAKQKSTLEKILSQFADTLVLVLIAAATISFFIGEPLDASVIIAIVILNALMGYIQEAKAEKALDALKKLSTDFAKVIRGGNIQKIEVEQLVPGDVIMLETGDKIPSDARVIEAVNLEISEAILTGESKPVKKIADVLSTQNIALGDQKNMLFKDTSVTYGRGKAVVTATGINTEIGKISQMLQSEVKDSTPLQKELDKVGKKLSIFAGIIIVLIFLLSILVKEASIKEMFLTSVSLAVAAIPEGLPAIVTIVLAVGVSRLARAKAIIRKLSAVETLGSVNYILTDKTGTLTQNQMTVTNISNLQNSFIIDNDGKFLNNGQIIDPNDDVSLLWLLKACVLCNDAELVIDNLEYKYIGDSTETALLEVAAKAGIDIARIRADYKRIYEIPFTSENKKMITVVQKEDEDRVVVFTKGAPEILWWIVNENNEEISEINNTYTQQGLRSLALSFKEMSLEDFNKAIKLENPENELSVYQNFLGVAAQKDPIRPEVKDAVFRAKSAGINTIMITGDHKLTAINIAKELDLITSDNEAIDGEEMANLTDRELEEKLKYIKVFARVSPAQKLLIVNKMKEKGKTVAVTGDGVNDAPAIKAADVGVSMGISGTDVSKEVSDMVLQDDNYATIVEAIKQGRIVYDNLVKFIRYLISCNISEILVVGISIALRFPLPLIPIQILWVNLVTDGLPALSLGMEPGEKDIMQRVPRPKSQSLLTKGRWIRMILEGLVITIGTFFVFKYALNISLIVAQTAALTTLSISQLFHAFNNRSEKHSILSKKLEPNNILILTLTISLILQALIVYTKIGNILLKTAPLDPFILFIALLAALIPLVSGETVKLLIRKNDGVEVRIV